jgi:hypothetical protein
VWGSRFTAVKGGWERVGRGGAGVMWRLCINKQGRVQQGLLAHVVECHPTLHGAMQHTAANP